MSLLEKSNENKRIARKCLDLEAYNAGISRAYYSAFQKAIYFIEHCEKFNYDAFLVKNKVDRNYIPHGKIQLALLECLMISGKKISLGEIILFDNLYHKRRAADYMDTMFTSADLADCLTKLDTILKLIPAEEVTNERH
jgi:hypothetical protein